MRGAKRKALQYQAFYFSGLARKKFEAQLQAVPNNMFRNNYARKRTLRRAYPCVRTLVCCSTYVSFVSNKEYKLSCYELRVKE